MISISDVISTSNLISKVIGSKVDCIDKPIELNVLNENPNALLWVNEKNIELTYKINQGVIICPDKVDTEKLNPDCIYLLSAYPRKLFQEILKNYFVKDIEFSTAVSSKIAANVTMGKRLSIGEHVIIEDNCTLGENVVIGHNSVIKSNTKIGNNVVIGSCNVIGGIGFGYVKNENNELELVPHIGGVIISDNVEIGNNTCIDRGVIGNTTIGKGSKIDNLVHIAHNVIIGENCTVIAHAMLGGSVVVGDNTWIAPGTSLRDGISIGSEVTIGLGAVVVKSVPDNEIWMGNPAKKK